MLSVHTIVQPTDFSERSRNAFELACSLARQHQAQLILVHVIATPPPPPLPYNEAGLGAVEDSEEAITQRMEELRASHSNLYIEYVLAESDRPADEIVRVAEDMDADLIVMGTHGRTGLSRALMGSVAEAVVRQAPCQVITVRDEESVTHREATSAGFRPSRH
jgi:nucleotide-binding universal stress UspA family protein